MNDAAASSDNGARKKPYIDTINLIHHRLCYFKRLNHKI